MIDFAIKNAVVSHGCYLHPSISFLGLGLPENVLTASGMLSVAERKMLYNLALKSYSAHGAVIDAGSFMGSSVVSLAQGLRDNPKSQQFLSPLGFNTKPISSYELGYLPKPRNGSDIVRKFGDVEYRFGDSFLGILKESIAPYEELIELYAGDFCDFEWSGTPIELCFVDLCKTPNLNRHVSSQFLPNLIEDASFFVNQDFFFDRLPWIKVTMGYLHDYFEWYGQVFTSSIYRSKKKIPKEVAEFDPFTEASLDECLRFHDIHASAHLKDADKFRMGLSRSYLIAMKGKTAHALDYLKYVEEEFSHILDDEATNDRGNNFRFKRAFRQIEREVV
ncbi:hypothetical protein PsAD46_03446 [Pseudovibrio sp. Ad46]|uniref:hypothetical protein n=1 Tax=unclassified Pseudovibrio TaxID=2627060 RepID=UPI00070CC5D9|nr:MULTISPECIES: hypothetical protein [unclassified Pseudovibrio]KZK84475.1 hypothetical protein PsAD46_03446 [Pseudovibrio sp. Ad46]KZK92598.1 hypothetical protein PsW74_05525 [Pseudovibrio sp. W74]KZL10361.1 hypothetical protein PsAD14_01268 [Pseudovibrio sp. Ad14]KZL22970.1 hypothetical protein PsWM33_03154 [Pseudovibrio sp. WM33]